MRTLWLVVVAVLAVMFPGPVGASNGVDPQRELANYLKTFERSREYLTPQAQRALATDGLRNFLDGVREQLRDPGRLFVTDVCWSDALACEGDPRLAHWDGLSQRVLFTARNGSTISGHAWATRAGPAKRPLVVITAGSVQATEQLYWWAAQSLAKAGYVVLTWDPQNQGRSDTFGHGADTGSGVPAQTTGNTFYDGTQDALDFALSRPDAPYCPRPSRSGRSYCGRQAASRVTKYMPYWRVVDPSRVGLAGHSYGAQGVSWVGQQDPRVDAVVAWDNLCNPTLPPTSLLSPSGGRALGSAGTSDACLTGGQGRPHLRVPSLGLSADYFLVPTPYLTRPDPLAKSAASMDFSAAGVDTGSIVIRGGTHYEFSYLPMAPFGATLRGFHLAAWYTTAWFDRYVKHDPSALRRLLTKRWLDDPTERSVDPGHDGNMFSFYYRSRLDLGHHGGPRVRCEDLRDGCSALVADDGSAQNYDVIGVATTPDR